MKNSYDQDSSDSFTTQLFEWAVGDVETGCEAATNVIKERASVQKKRLKEEAEYVDVENKLADFGNAAVEILGEAGFEADFEINPHNGQVVVSFDDVDGIFTERRKKLVEAVVNRLCEHVGGTVVGIDTPSFGLGGNITVGLLSGIGFGAVQGLNKNFDPFKEKKFETAEQLDVNVSDNVISRINELIQMWDGDYKIYAEGVDITLREMDESERTSLKAWIEGNRNTVGIPGTTLEEVLIDIHRRIHSYD